MNKLQLEQLIKPLIDIYDNIELELIKSILERIDNYSSVRGTVDWYLDKLSDLGTFKKHNLKIIKSEKEEIKKVLADMFNDASYDVKKIKQYKEYYQGGLLSTDPSKLYKSDSIKRLINNAIKDSSTILDLINTTALECASESYKEILNKAYIETASGVYSYDEAIRRALLEFSKKGIQTVHYDSGIKLSIEGVVRRDIITRMNKLTGDVELQNAKELGTNLVYVDQHLGARIRTEYTKHDYEAHAEWQGKVYMLDGSTKEYPNFYEKTGYGEMLGLKGINCYHDFRAYFKWEKLPEKISLEENKKAYELTKKMRQYERKIRHLKREQLIAKQEGYEDVLTKNKKKYDSVNKEYVKWLKNNDLTRNYSREYVIITKNSVPKYQMENNRVYMSKRELRDNFSVMNSIVDKHTSNKSKWSGNIIIDNDANAGKLWNCDIRIKNESTLQEISHELLHAHSISYFDNKVYEKYLYEEEATVEFFNKQIFTKERLPYYENGYINMVNCLEEICDILETDKYEFAKNLFNIKVTEREMYLRNIIENNSHETLLVELLEEAFVKWNM